MQKFSGPRMILLVVASVSFVLGLCGTIIFSPEDGCGAGQARGAESGERLTWQTSLAAGASMAKQEHKYVLADVYTDWCGWCKKLDKDVFTNSKVVKYLQKDFICVKVNAEDPKEGQTVANSYKVDGYPCALVFSSEGKLIGRVGGYEAAKDYINTLNQITGRSGEAEPEAGNGDK